MHDFRQADAMGSRVLAAIFAGGVAGGLARAGLERQWPADGHSWPWTTLAANLAGTALLAYVITRLSHRPYARPLIGIGVCGALTTFSTLQLEALELADNDHAALGAAYAATSIAAGLLIAYAMSRSPARMGPDPESPDTEPAP
jgi:CrcB protein